MYIQHTERMLRKQADCHQIQTWHTHQHTWDWKDITGRSCRILSIIWYESRTQWCQKRVLAFHTLKEEFIDRRKKVDYILSRKQTKNTYKYIHMYTFRKLVNENSAHTQSFKQLVGICWANWELISVRWKCIFISK